MKKSYIWLTMLFTVVATIFGIVTWEINRQRKSNNLIVNNNKQFYNKSDNSNKLRNNFSLTSNKVKSGNKNRKTSDYTTQNKENQGWKIAEKRINQSIRNDDILAKMITKQDEIPDVKKIKKFLPTKDKKPIETKTKATNNKKATLKKSSSLKVKTKANSDKPTIDINILAQDVKQWISGAKGKITKDQLVSNISSKYAISKKLSLEKLNLLTSDKYKIIEYNKSKKIWQILN
ncbi:Uncharacterised protein [Mesomycoplasma conjunctivae]|uniref:hypothetical protein n=1 Tax=Mesomycoplasma conjunctivae TaxID=45361 RepID=UPI001004F435|nr:hypothetical protein [Mesomycoplasma conjunctivae]VEU66087.1 Uncharacterised protein [Mesomycoplasma conjunctivae]